MRSAGYVPTRIRIVLVLLLLTTGCAPRPAPDPADIFAVEGAEFILRPASDQERQQILTQVRALHDQFGYAPDADQRELTRLDDLFDQPDLYASLFREDVLAFTGRLREWGFTFLPGEARRLVTAAEGPVGEALADPAVEAFLRGLFKAGLLHEQAGLDALRLSGSRAKALRTLARAADGRTRVDSFAALFPYRFRPSDALGLLAAGPTPLTAADAVHLRPLLDRLGAEARPGYLPELRILAEKPRALVGLLAAADEAGIRLTGPRAILALARLTRDHMPLRPAERDRLTLLAKELLRPDQESLPHLVVLAREPRITAVLKVLETRYRYRFRHRDSVDLLTLARAGVPRTDLPEWIMQDRPPLLRPALLLFDRPAEAFAPVNDLVFLDALSLSRPEIVRRSRAHLEREIRRRLAHRPVRFRAGAPYREDAEDLSRFTRPDLLKIRLTLDALDRPVLRAWLLNALRRDVADRTTEYGGYVRLGGAGRLHFSLHQPGAGQNDRLNLPPDPEGSAMDFHFHATDRDDTPFAGPSSGGPGTDLFRAARHGVDGVVFTRLPEGRCNVDWYSSGKTVLDLGVLGPEPGSPEIEKSR